MQCARSGSFRKAGQPLVKVTIAVARKLAELGFGISNNDIKVGLKNANFTSRFEILSKKQLL